MRTRAATAWREAEQTTDWAAAEEAADILLRLDPGNERVLRGLLRARALLGKPQEADATFAEFRDQMRPLDPHWEPEEETALLVIELENVANADQHLTANRSSSFEAPSLVGREHELRWLLSHIRTAPPDQFTLIQVTGSEGIGKTRLVEAALAQAPLHGVQVASSECTELSHQIPFSGLSRILSSERVLAIIRGVPESSRVVLASFVTAVGFPASSTPLVNEPSQTPGSIWEAFRMAFEELARLRTAHRSTPTKPPRTEACRITRRYATLSRSM